MKPPQQLQSLKDRLAGVARRGAAAAQEGGDLRARIKARIEQLGRDSADLGASLNSKVEELLKPRPADPPTATARPVQPEAPAAPAAYDVARDPTTEVPEAAPLSSEPVAQSEPVRDTIVTRTFGRVGLTAVHARLGALARMRKKAPAVPAPAPYQAPATEPKIGRAHV